MSGPYVNPNQSTRLSQDYLGGEAGVRPSVGDLRSKIPMSAATRRKLRRLAQQMSTTKRRVSPMQVAAQLLEEAVAVCPAD